MVISRLGFVYSLEEYLASPPNESLVPKSVWSQDVAYRDPFYPESGAIFLPITWSPMAIVNDDIGKAVDLHDTYGSATSLHGWNASGSWYVFGDMLWYANGYGRRVACSSDPADGMCQGPTCFMLNSSLLSGNMTTIVSETLQASEAELLMEENEVWEMYGTEILRFSLQYHSVMTAEEVLETYAGLVANNVQPGQQACHYEFMLSLPLLDYPY